MNRANIIFVIFIGTVFLLLAGCAIPNNILNSNNATSNGITFSTTTSVGATQTIPAATSGHPYNTKITISGGSPPYACSAAPGTTLPGALVFSEPGCSITGMAPTLDSGTPTKIFPISFIVIDSKGTVGGPFNLQLVVNRPSLQLNLPATIDTATIGTAYQYNFCDPTQQTAVNCVNIPNT